MFTHSAGSRGPSTLDRRPSRSRFRSAGVVAALCAATALTVGACGSGDSTGTETSTPATPQATSTSAPAGASDASGLTGAEQQAITTAFEQFFDGSSDADTKLANIEDPDRFADTIRAQADLSLAQSTTVHVEKMDLVAPGRAAVTYTILMDDEPVLKDQQGYAVQADGTWKVSASSFCGLLTLENGGNPPEECG